MTPNSRWESISWKNKEGLKQEGYNFLDWSHTFTNIVILVERIELVKCTCVAKYVQQQVGIHSKRDSPQRRAAKKSY